MLPFTHQQFLDVFAAYNAAVWPAQGVAWLAGLATCALMAGGMRASGPIVALVLATGWAWTGIAYHLLQFARINPAAYAFAALFVGQAALFVLAAWRGELAFAGAQGWRRTLGWALVAYAALLYPLVGIAIGTPPAQLAMFGITPCPLTLFTFGVLLLAAGRLPWWLLVVPVAWSLVGGSAAFLLRVPQDWPLLACVALLPVLLRRPGRPLAAQAALF